MATLNEPATDFAPKPLTCTRLNLDDYGTYADIDKIPKVGTFAVSRVIGKLSYNNTCLLTCRCE